MDGQNVVEIMFSNLKDENPSFRMDSNFYDKSVLITLSKVKNQSHYYLRRENIVNGPFGSTITTDSHLDSGYIPLVRSLNINRGFYINDNDLVYISEEDNDIIKHSQLFKDDIVLSRVGSIGFFARVAGNMGTCNISSNNIGIKLGCFSESERHYILTYLNTKIAFDLINRRVSGNVQPKLTVDEICRIPIPSFSADFYDTISSLVLKSEQDRNSSCSCYKSAEALLMRALGLNGFVPSTQTVEIKSFSESFSVSGRLDAEYYQKKYDEYIDKLGKFETTTIPVEFYVFKNSGTDYANSVSDVGVIKTKQLTNDGINYTGVESYFDDATCIKNKSIFLENGDVVFAAMGVGSLGKVSLHSYHGYKRFVTDSTLRIYRKKTTGRVCPEVLSVYLQSVVGQELIYRYVVGSTGIINIYDADIAKIPIPIFDNDIQKEIVDKVQESYKLHSRSEMLLDFAKDAVEIAIENNEETSLKWLKEKGVEISAKL